MSCFVHRSPTSALFLYYSPHFSQHLTPTWYIISSPPLISSVQPKTVVSDSPRLVNFVIRLVNSVLELPQGKAKSFGKFKLLASVSCNTYLIFLSKVISMRAPFKLSHVVWPFTQCYLKQKKIQLQIYHK